MREAGLVVVGASVAGLRAVETARREGYDGPITLVGAEEHLPYDRPPLSKEFLAGGEQPTFPGVHTLAEQGVELKLGAPAAALSLDEREVAVGDELVPFDSLILATGCVANSLPAAVFPNGTTPDGVHTLRTIDDAHAIRRHVEAAARTVVIGAGFIGAEVASALRARGAEVTIIEAAAAPLQHAVGEQIAAELLPLHARNDVEVRCATTAVTIEANGPVKKLTLSDGTVIAAALVVVGIGARPATDWLAGSGLTLSDGVVCDETLAAAAGVYAAGDIARWPNPLFANKMRCEHWTTAVEQAAAAARNALHPQAASPFETVPYFWSDWYGQRIQMVGIVGHDEVKILDDRSDDSWLALYRAGDRLVGAVALARPGRIMKYRALIARRSSWADALAFATAS